VSNGDIQEAIEAAKGKSSVLLPPTVEALPEEQAWKMLATEGGFLFLAVVLLWRQVRAILEEARAQNRHLIEAQAAAIAKLGETMIRVEGAIQISDKNNLNAIGRLSDTVSQTIARLDKHELKLDAHHDSLLHHSNRLSLLESRRTPASTPVPKT
jgi:hypothetical protein